MLHHRLGQAGAAGTGHVSCWQGSWSSEGLGQGQEGPWMGAFEGLEWVQDVQSAAEKRDPSTLTDRLVFWASHVGPLRLIPTFLAKRTE